MINHKLHTIICGSKSYNSINFSNIINNKFNNIVRHNKTIHGKPYGHKTTLQVVNEHVWKAIKNKWTLEKYIKYYNGYHNYQISPDHIKLFIQHIQPLYANDQVKYYPFNNYRKVQQIIKKYLNSNDYKDSFCSITPIFLRINGHPRELHTRCGLSHVVECISNQITPLLVGYELEKPHKSKHMYINHPRKSAHDNQAEIKLITQLHNEKLLDASLCLIRDNGTLIDKFKPTQIGLQLLQTL